MKLRGNFVTMCKQPILSEERPISLLGMFQMMLFHFFPSEFLRMMCPLVAVTERVLAHAEKPWRIMQQIRKESIHQMLKTRFYLQEKEDPHGSNIALFIGNLPQNLSQRQYHSILMSFIGEGMVISSVLQLWLTLGKREVLLDNPFTSIGIIYYEYGAVVITYDNNETAVAAFNSLKVAVFDDKNLLVMLLPNIQVSAPCCFFPKCKVGAT